MAGPSAAAGVPLPLAASANGDVAFVAGTAAAAAVGSATFAVSCAAADGLSGAAAVAAGCAGGCAANAAAAGCSAFTFPAFAFPAAGFTGCNVGALPPRPSGMSNSTIGCSGCDASHARSTIQ